jgi:hypothetical protein
MQPAALIAAALTGSAPRRSESGSCIARETSMRLHLATIKASTRPTASSDRSRHPADSGLRAAWSPPAGFYPAALGERVGRCPLLMLWTAPPPADNNRSHRAPARDSCGSTHHIFRACAVPPYRTLLRETPGPSESRLFRADHTEAIGYKPRFRHDDLERNGYPQFLPNWLVALQNPDVIRSLESRRIRDVALAQAATNAVERFEIARGKPALETIEQHLHVVDSMF